MCVPACVHACVRACVRSVVVSMCKPGGGSVGSCRYVSQRTSVLCDMHSVHLKTVCHVVAGTTSLMRQR